VSNLILNVDVMKFITKNSAHSKLHIGYKEKYIERDSEYKISWFTNWQPQISRTLFRTWCLC